MTLNNFSGLSLKRLALASLALSMAFAAPDSQLLTATPPHKVDAGRNATVEAAITLQLRDGYHVNSNSPHEDFLIPLHLRWEPGPLSSAEVTYPKPEERNYSFSSKPVSIYSGEFRIVTLFKVDADAAAGPGILVGKLRYQACSETTCYRPATLEIRLPYEIH